MSEQHPSSQLILTVIENTNRGERGFDISRDKFFTASEAQKYGLVDDILYREQPALDNETVARGAAA